MSPWKSASSDPGLDDRGFTLIEIIVVLVLMGILLGLSFPKFRDTLLVDNLDTVCRRIIGQAELLREQAVRDQQAYTMHIDFSGNRIWIDSVGLSEDELAQAEAKAFVLPADVTFRDVWTAGKGKQYVDEALVRFTEKGYVEHTMIHLGADDGREYSLELTPFLGTIKIYQQYVDVRTAN